jgi:hypothetical protein
VYVTEFRQLENKLCVLVQKQSLFMTLFETNSGSPLMTPFETNSGSAECHLSAFEDVKNGVMIG